MHTTLKLIRTKYLKTQQSFLFSPGRNQSLADVRNGILSLKM